MYFFKSKQYFIYITKTLNNDDIKVRSLCQITNIDNLSLFYPVSLDYMVHGIWYNVYDIHLWYMPDGLKYDVSRQFNAFPSFSPHWFTFVLFLLFLWTNSMLAHAPYQEPVCSLCVSFHLFFFFYFLFYHLPLK